MKTISAVVALGLGCIVGHACAQEHWLEVLKSAKTGTWQVNTDSVKVAGDMVKFRVKRIPPDYEKKEEPDVAYAEIDILAKCRGDAVTGDNFASYRPNGSVALTSNEPQTVSPVTGGAWGTIVDAVCDSKHISR